MNIATLANKNHTIVPSYVKSDILSPQIRNLM